MEVAAVLHGAPRSTIRRSNIRRANPSQLPISFGCSPTTKSVVLIALRSNRILIGNLNLLDLHLRAGNSDWDGLWTDLLLHSSSLQPIEVQSSLGYWQHKS